MTHTPGPWKVVKNDPRYGTVFSYEIRADQYSVEAANLIGTITDRGYLADREVEANARLIADAPGLLAALDDAAARLDFLTNWIENSYGGSNQDVELGRSYAREVHAAITHTETGGALEET